MKRGIFTRRFFCAPLFIITLFAFFACSVESDDSRVTLLAASPSENSAHGYSSADLVSCKIEMFGNGGDLYTSQLLSADTSFSVGGLKSGNYYATAYGYDAFGSAIAVSAQAKISVGSDDSVSKSLPLEWRESGKDENQYCYINFDTDGGSEIKQQKVKSGNTVEKPADSTKDGWSLEGWYWDASRDFKFDFDMQISWNLTLHAKWVEAEEGSRGNSDDSPDVENPDDSEKGDVGDTKDDGAGDDSLGDDSGDDGNTGAEDGTKDDETGGDGEEKEDSEDETKVPLEISVTLPDYSDSDIAISDESSGTMLTLVATSGYDSYSWEFDGTADNSQTGNSFTKDLSSLAGGSYDVYLEATKDGNVYSCLVQVTVSSGAADSGSGDSTTGNSGTTTVPASGGVVNGVECNNLTAVYSALHALPDNAEATITLGSDFSFNLLNPNQGLLWSELQQKNNRSITLDFSNCTTTKFSGLALQNLQSIVGIIFPKTLREIEANAFNNCNRLELVTFAEGSVLETIGAKAFYQTTALKEISLPETVKSIGAKAFENSALTKLEFKNTSDTWTITGSRGTISDYGVDNEETNATNIRTSSEYTGAWTRN